MNKEEESKAKRAQKLVAKYQRVFSSTEGREVLHDLMRGSFFFRTTHVPGDPYTAAFHEGQRATVMTILRLLKMDPERFVNLVNEQKEDSHVEI